MPYANREDQRACDRRYRQRNLDARRMSARTWNRTHPAAMARTQARYIRRARERIFHRDGWACAYCGSSGTAATLTRDHKIPLARGGQTVDDNLVTACRSCNQRKGVKSYAEFRAQLRRERRAEAQLEPLWITNHAADLDDVGEEAMTR